MFVRRKRNKSGTTSIQVVAKVSGKYRVQKSFGCSRDETILASLERKARQRADEHEFGEELFISESAAEYDTMMDGIGQHQLWPVVPGPAHLLVIDPFAPILPQLVQLTVQVLVLGGDPRISDSHFVSIKG